MIKKLFQLHYLSDKAFLDILSSILIALSRSLSVNNRLTVTRKLGLGHFFSIPSKYSVFITARPLEIH